MNIDQFKEGQELLKLIESTEKALENLKGLKPSADSTSSRNIYYDGMYWLSISQHKDGSGVRGDLTRNFGNKQLLDVILIELERQLEEFKSKFESL